MNVGLIGKGYWGTILLSKLEKICDVKFICNSKDNYKTKLDLVDWVFIATPNDTHFNIVKYCLQSKKNVFCEKPLTPSYKDCIKLYNIADKVGVKLYVSDVFNYRNETKLLDLSKTNLKVIWNNPNNTDFKNLMYHDLYLLYPLLKKDLKINMTYINNIKFTYNVTDTKEHWVAGIDFTHKPSTNDALYDMVKKVLNNKVNYDYNKKITLNCSLILNKI